MKVFFQFIVILFLGFAVKAQDTVYLDIDLQEVSKSDPYIYYKITSYMDSGSNIIVNDNFYYRSGKHYTNETLIVDQVDNKIKRKIGEEKVWYESGQLKSVVNYDNGKINGFVRTFWENGQQKREDIFINYIFKKGITWDDQGIETTHTPFIERASYIKDWNMFLMNNLRYPKYPRDNEIQGKVIVEFTIEKDGNVSNIQIVKSVHPDLDAEVIRLIKLAGKWNPGKLDGEAVRSILNLPISFRFQ